MSKNAPSAKKKKAVNIQRITIGVVVSLGIAALVMISSGDDPVDISDSGASLQRPANIGGSSSLNVKVRDDRVTALEKEDHDAEIKKAREGNRAASVLAPLPKTFKKIVPESNKPIVVNNTIKGLSAGQIAGNKNVNRPVNQTAFENQRLKQLSVELKRFTQLLKPSGPSVVLVDNNPLSNPDGVFPNPSVSNNNSNNSSITDVAEIDSGNGFDGHKFNAGDIAYAVTDIGVMSDEPGPIRLTVLSGPAKGAILVGSYSLPTSRSKAVIMEINTVQFANETFSMNAFVLNADTYRPGIASSVDTHFFLRWGSFLGSAIISSVGNAIREQNTALTSTVGAPAGTTPTVTTNPTFTPSQRGWVIAADVADKVTPIVEENFNTPNTVLVNPNEPVVIMFMDSVVFPKKNK